MKRVLSIIVRIIFFMLIFAMVGFLVYYFAFGKGEVNLDPGEPSFSDSTVTYDGEYHTIEVENLKEGMTVTYESEYSLSSSFRDAGEYNLIAWVFDKDGRLYECYEAILTIHPRNVLVTMDERLVDHGETLPQSYTVDGLIEGDELDGYISYDESGAPIFDWNNKNYSVTAIGGNMRIIDTLVDGIGDDPYFQYLPISLLPVTFADTTIFENKIITSITFPAILIDECDENDLKLIIYVVKSDLSTKREECTVENGKKHVIDLKDIILDIENNPFTVSGLNIKVGEGETLAFGDTDMQFSFAVYRDNEDNPLIRSVFDDPLGSVHSLPIKVDGYWYFGGEE